MRYMALDIGEKRCGIAISDDRLTCASPLKVLPSSEVFALSKSFRSILEDYEVDALVCGLPLSLNGEYGQWAEKTADRARALGEALGLKVIFVDERLSSQEAKRLGRELGYSEKQMRGKLDMIAASLTLDSFLKTQDAKKDVSG